MARFKQGSRYRGGVYGTLNGITVIFPRIINFKQIKPVSTYTVTNRSEFRPDLISLDVFKRPDIGWYILAFNNIDRIDTLKAGLILSVPPVQGIIL